MRQIPLPLYKDNPQDSLIITASNEAIFNRLSENCDNNARLLLIGDAHSGKKLMGRYFEQSWSAIFVANADRLSDTELFFKWNNAHDEQRPLLFSSDKPASEWSIDLPDLQSRIASMELLEISPPDDELITELIQQRLRNSDVGISSKALSYCIKRIERSYGAMNIFINACIEMANEENSVIKLTHVKQLL